MSDKAAPTMVLRSAEYIAHNSIDVAIDPTNTKRAAEAIYTLMQSRQYSTQAWSAHELHPKPQDGEKTVAFIFTMDLLNFSFWSEKPESERFAVEYRGSLWIGYWSLVACLQRAIDEGKVLSFACLHIWVFHGGRLAGPMLRELGNYDPLISLSSRNTDHRSGLLD